MSDLVDTHGLVAAFERAGDAMARAWHTAGLSFHDTSARPGDGHGEGAAARTPAAVVLAAGGVDADAARLALAVCDPPVPALVVDGLTLPSFVGPSTLVLGVGTSPEWVHAQIAATTRGAHVVEIARDAMLDADAARVDLGARVATWARALHDRGLAADGVPADVAAAARRLAALTPALAAPGSPAAVLARRIDRLFPYVLGAGEWSAHAAAWWRRQWVLTTKGPAFAAALPRLAHDDVAMFGQHGDVTRGVLVSVLLRASADGPRCAAAVGPLVDVLDEVTAEVLEVAVAPESEQAPPLVQVLELAAFGDAVALHRTRAEGLDPGPVPSVVEFLGRLDAR